MVRVTLFFAGFITALAIWGGPGYSRVQRRIWTRIPPGYDPTWTGPKYRRWVDGVEVPV